MNHFGDVPQYNMAGQQQHQHQQQLLQQQQQLLLQIALKKAQLVQQQQLQLALYHRQQQQQKQQLLNQQHFNQQLQRQQQAQIQNQLQYQSSPRNVESPINIESDQSDENVAFAQRYDEIEEWEIPPKELILKINQQVEYYFSNEYLTRDAYFLRQIRRKREGYLSMKLITNFKKVRKLVKDPRITSYCLRHSQHLQVNEDGTKVRRQFPIPENLSRFAVSRSLLIKGVPSQLATIECMMSIFYQFGDITSVRVLRPGKEIPHDLRDGLGKLHLKDIAAVVEFEATESAANAFHRFSINNEICYEGRTHELCVSLLGSGEIESELDSGCGSSSSGDENEKTQQKTKNLNKFLDNLDDDYESYMRSMRNERKQENKEDVPLVIAALMDEYGEACTIPESKRESGNKTGNVLKHVIQFGEKSDENQIRKPTTNVWATNENQWTTTQEQNNTEEHTAKILDILTGSALSAFGGLRLGGLDCSEAEIEDDFCAPPVETGNKSETSQKPEMQWATVARK